jgi:hypothetical protein
MIGHASPARLHLRTPVAPLMPSATYGPCSLPAWPIRLQEAPAGGGRAHPPRHPGHRQRHHAVDRQRLAGRLHPCGVRPLAGNRQAPGAGRVGRLRLCPSHSRWCWGRGCTWCTLHGLPVAFVLTGANAVPLLRPTRKGEAEPSGGRLFRPLRQRIESVNDTFKGPAGPRAARRPDVRGRPQARRSVQVAPQTSCAPWRRGSWPDQSQPQTMWQS